MSVGYNFLHLGLYLKKRVTKGVVFFYGLWLDDGEKEVA